MMEKNPTKRFTTEQALRHPWLVLCLLNVVMFWTMITHFKPHNQHVTEDSFLLDLWTKVSAVYELQSFSERLKSNWLVDIEAASWTREKLIWSNIWGSFQVFNYLVVSRMKNQNKGDSKHCMIGQINNHS